MPGAAGGGHSSGGGHSGSFGGGHSSGGHSSGGHSGSFGGGHSGSFGGGSRSSGSYRSTGGYRSYGGYRRGRGSGSGCLSGAAAAVLLPMIVIFVLIFVISGVFSNISGYNISELLEDDPPAETETFELVSERVQAEKLDEALCTPLEHTVETDLPDVLTAENAAQIEEGIAFFYENTGVQPYFMFMSGIDGDPDPDYDTVNDYLYDKYVELFGEDEGHLLLLMLWDGENYVSWYILGNDVYNLMDDADVDDILTFIDENYGSVETLGYAVKGALVKSAAEVMTETVYRPAGAPAKLDASLCTPLDTTVETDLPDVLDDYGQEKIGIAIDYFYDTTGVQPYFLLLGGLDGVARPDKDAVSDFMNDKYVELFGEDEGHLLLAMFYDNGDYDTWYLIGYDANDVFTDADCESLLDNVDYYAAETYSVSDALSNAFTVTANQWEGEIYFDPEPTTIHSSDFYETQEKLQMAIGGVATVGMMVFAVVVFVLLMRRIRSGANRRNQTSPGSGNAYNPYGAQNTGGNQPASDFGSNSGSYPASGGASKRPAGVPRANYPVRCPYCGATAYPKDNGTCEYCGSRIPDKVIRGEE